MSQDPWDGLPIVYMATNLINGKRYIGVTSQRLCQRKAKHIGNARRGIERKMPIVRAIRKYGEDMLRFVVLKTCADYDEAKREEIRLIAALKPKYNRAPGGAGYVGYRPTPEAIEKIRKANTGRPGFWTGKKLPAHVVEQQRQRNLQPEAKLRWEEFRAMGPRASARAVICLDDGKVFDSVSAAARAYGTDSSALSELCRGIRGRRTLTGRRFKFHEETNGPTARS